MRVVLDTNVLISALLFSRTRMDWLRRAWQAGTIRPVVDRATAEELLRVLAYPKFRLTPTEQEDILSDFLPYAETVGEVPVDAALPRCDDADDQKFVNLAATAKVDALVSGDAALLALAGQLAQPVLTVDQLRQRLEAL